MKRSILTTIIAAALAGCSNDKYQQVYPGTSSSCDTTNITYSKDIVPIVMANCAISGGCHDAAGAAVSGYNYTTYQGIKAVANHDFLINDIMWTPTAGHNSMPKNGNKLSDCDINKFIRWVNTGAPDN